MLLTLLRLFLFPVYWTVLRGGLSREQSIDQSNKVPVINWIHPTSLASTLSVTGPQGDAFLDLKGQGSTLLEGYFTPSCEEQQHYICV